MERRRLINVALGREPADVIVAGGQVLSVHTGEILRADVRLSAAASRLSANCRRPFAALAPASSTPLDYSFLPA
jgi:adenine deaminase